MDIHYRGATLEDLPALLPLVEGFAREQAELTGHQLKDSFMDSAASMLEQALRHPEVFAVIAEAGGRAVAYATAAIQEPPPIFTAEPFLFISDLYVLPEVRGRGVATELVERIKGFGFLRGMPRLSMVVPAGSAAACRVMEKIGFSQVEGLYFWQA